MYEDINGFEKFCADLYSTEHTLSEEACNDLTDAEYEDISSKIRDLMADVRSLALAKGYRTPWC